MSNKNYNEMIRAFAALSESEQKMFIASITGLSLSPNHSKSCSDMVKEKSYNDGCPDCPRCGSKANLGYVSKKGFYRNGSQRYKCKSCNKYFTAATNTVFEGSHKDADTWKKFIQMTVAGKSIAKCAEECGLCIQAAFTWRHKVLNAFRVHQETLSMEGKIEIDEMLIPTSFKGNHVQGGFWGRRRLHGADNNLPRKSYKRGTDNKPKSNKERACVFCMTKNGNEAFYAAVPGVGAMLPDMLDNTLAKHVNKEGSVVVADQYPVTLKYLEENGYKYVGVLSNTSDNPHDHKPEIKGEYHLQHVNAMHHHIRVFLKPYYGVSSKYLANYVALYTWLKNVAANKQKKRLDEVSIRRASSPDCYLTRKAIESMPAIPYCA